MIKRALISFAVVTAAAFSMADAFDNQVASIVLLQNKAVQKELKITAAQLTKMNVFAEKFNADQKAYIDALNKSGTKTNPPKRDTKKEMEMVTKLKTQVLGVLSQTQIVRLRQISLQAIGVAALADDTVAKRVGLNATQIKQVRTIVDKGLKQGQTISNQAMAEAQKGIKEPKSEAEAKKAKAEFDKRWKVVGPPAQKKLDELKRKTIGEVMALLTSGQKSIWTSLNGPVFKVS